MIFQLQNQNYKRNRNLGTKIKLANRKKCMKREYDFVKSRNFERKMTHETLS